MKKITKNSLGVTTHIYGIEIAGTFSLFATAFIMFLFMWISTQDLFASLFFPLIMIGMWVVMYIIQIFKFYLRNDRY